MPGIPKKEARNELSKFTVMKLSIETTNGDKIFINHSVGHAIGKTSKDYNPKPATITEEQFNCLVGSLKVSLERSGLLISSDEE